MKQMQTIRGIVKGLRSEHDNLLPVDLMPLVCAGYVHRWAGLRPSHRAGQPSEHPTMCRSRRPIKSSATDGLCHPLEPKVRCPAGGVEPLAFVAKSKLVAI
jgi:hypothetical protein